MTNPSDDPLKSAQDAEADEIARQIRDGELVPLASWSATFTLEPVKPPTASSGETGHNLFEQVVNEAFLELLTRRTDPPTPPAG